MFQQTVGFPAVNTSVQFNELGLQSRKLGFSNIFQLVG